MINKFYLLCVIFSGSPDLTLKTCLVVSCCYVNSDKSRWFNSVDPAWHSIDPPRFSRRSGHLPFVSDLTVTLEKYLTIVHEPYSV